MQNNIAYHDVNPVLDISGQRNAFYMAISSSKRIWKKIPRTKINIKYNKNRVEESFAKKITNTIKKLIVKI